MALRACCAGGCGRDVARAECRVWAANLYMFVHVTLGLNRIEQAVFNKSNKIIDAGAGVSTGFCDLYLVRLLNQ